MDRRITPFSGRVALNTLRGTLDAPHFSAGTPARVTLPVVDLLSQPGGPGAHRDRQLLWGAEVTEIERRADHVFVQAAYDGYCGWVSARALTTPHAAATHWVSAPSTHLYEDPDFKSREIASLSLGSRVTVRATSGPYAEVEGGWIPLQHLAQDPAKDPVAIAESLLGTPYLWGGNSRFGIDCSGLVQIGLAAAGRACAGDSDLQRKAFPPIDDIPRRGDVMFWPGHVAWVADEARILHANSTFMCVMYEGIEAAKARIEAQGDGPFLGLHRP